MPVVVTERDKRTIRWGATAIAIYLVLFFGVRAWKHLESSRSDYEQLLVEAQRIQRELQPYENRVLLAEKLKENLHLDPKRLTRATLVAQASAAIQATATSGGVQLGPMRESAARISAKELGSMQLEGSGPVAAIMTLLQRLGTLGYPLVLDSVQINSDPTKPGMVKINLSIIILDFDQWKQEEAPNA
jgi:hypothetical protein